MTAKFALSCQQTTLTKYELLFLRNEQSLLIKERLFFMKERLFFGYSQNHSMLVCGGTDVTVSHQLLHRDCNIML